MRKTLKRNLSYDDRNHLYYVSLYYDCLLYTSDAADEL